MIRRSSFRGRMASLAAALTIAACGGGGGSSDPPAPAQTTSAACAAKRSVAGYDVVLMIGQSNMAGFGAYIVPAFDLTDPRIEQWGSAGKAILASEPLEHPDLALHPGRIGPGLAFGRAYIKNLPTNRKLLLVPAAYGGTGFITNDWNPGDRLYIEAVRRTNEALATDPQGNCMAAILWSQGETDAVGSFGTAAYTAALDRMISSLRRDIAATSGVATAPFLLGQFSPDWIAPRPTAAQQAILDAINATPGRVAYTALVSTEGLLSNNTQGLAAPVHLDAASQRIYGVRFFTAIDSAIRNTAAR